VTFAIKAAVGNPRAATFTFDVQRTMYGGKHIARGDVIPRSGESCGRHRA
jgi:hypothetical protein